MCRSKSEGGIRCSSQEKARVQNLENRLGDARSIGDAAHIAYLEEKLVKAERDYNLTPCGRGELADRMNDDNLSLKDRATAKRKLTEAEASLEKRRQDRYKAFKKQAALREVLQEAGIDKHEIESLISLGASEDQQKWLRPARYYKGLIKKLSEQKQTLLAELDEEEARIWAESTTDSWSREETDQALDAFEATKIDRLAPLNRKLQEARFSYNCTVEGQERLKQKIADLPASAYQKRAKLRWALQSAERFHRARLTHRDKRTLFNSRIKKVMTEAGADPQKAMDAYRKPETADADTRMDPHERVSGNRVHLTEKDHHEILSAFRASKEYEEQGERGLNDFLRSRVRQDPRTLHHGSVDDANSRVAIFKTAKAGRNPTSKAGIRTSELRVILSKKERSELAETASSLKMSFSSYARAMFLGNWENDPFAYQNDRSPEHRSMKAQQMKKLLEEH